MASVYFDLSDVIYQIIKGTAAVTNLLVNGVSSVVLAGILKATDLDTASTTRTTAATPAKALYVTIQNGGERNMPDTTHISEQLCIVRIHDRPIGSAYNIKRVAEEIKSAVRSSTSNLDGTSRGMLGIQYISASDIDWDGYLDTSYQALIFSSLISNHQSEGI